MRYSPLLLLVLLATAASMEAQIRFVGTVRDADAETPIGDVHVEVLDPYSRPVARARTDENGRFVATVTKDGRYRLRTRHHAYKQTRTPVLWTDGDDLLEVEIRLHPEVVLLAPLEIKARSRGSSPILEGYRHRLRLGLGYFITRDDILARAPTVITDMLAQVPGVWLESSGSGFSRRVRMARSRGGIHDCPVQMFVDGRLINSRVHPARPDIDVSLDDVVSPQAVEGIEVYRGISSVPAEFMNPESRCGVVAVWTRRGG